MLDSKNERNATCPGLSNPTSLKFIPARAATLCQRAGYLHAGNALSALGRDEEAREYYERVLPLLAAEPRCSRLDWERSSALINIGNTYSRQGNYEKANECYTKAEQLGIDQMEADGGNKVEGSGIKMVAMRARSFALKKIAPDDAKTLLRKVLEMQKEFSELCAKEKAEMERLESAADAATDGNLIVRARV
jgi:tetratricopeptide (TPR) repeat protein